MEAQMKPSVTTSVKGSFPLLQPSPVQAVMAAFNANPPTAFVTSPSTNTQYSPTEIANDKESLYTPSKWMERA